MLARASTKTFVSRIRIRELSPKNSGKNLRNPKNSLAGSLVSRGIAVSGVAKLVSDEIQTDFQLNLQFNVNVAVQSARKNAVCGKNVRPAVS